MNRESFENMVAEILALMCSITVGPTQELADASHAVDAGTATDEQLALVTNVVHRAFDVHDGCMVTTLRELIENGAPHYFVMHAIRTYVRLCDRREADAAQAIL